MTYVDQSLEAGERVVYRTRLHWSTVLPGFFIGLCLDGGSILLLVRAFAERSSRSGVSGLYAGAAVVLLTLSAFVYLAIMVQWNAAEFAVTDRRVLMRTGITQRQTVELPLREVAAMSVDQNPMGKLLGFGEIRVAAANGTSETFKHVSAPRRLQQETEKRRNAPLPA